jgi:hypothetical protein
MHVSAVAVASRRFCGSLLVWDKPPNGLCRQTASIETLSWFQLMFAHRPCWSIQAGWHFVLECSFGCCYLVMLPSRVALRLVETHHPPRPSFSNLATLQITPQLQIQCMLGGVDAPRARWRPTCTCACCWVGIVWATGMGMAMGIEQKKPNREPWDVSGHPSSVQSMYR